MLIEVFLEGVFVQVGLQSKNFFRYFLVFALDPLEFSLPLVEMQALCFELDIGDGVTFAKPCLRQIDWRLLACRNLYQLLKQLLVVPLDLGLFYCSKKGIKVSIRVMFQLAGRNGRIHLPCCLY